MVSASPSDLLLRFQLRVLQIATAVSSVPLEFMTFLPLRCFLEVSNRAGAVSMQNQKGPSLAPGRTLGREHSIAEYGP